MNVTIGKKGHGTLNISNGATVTSVAASIGEIDVGEGIVNLQGEGSSWNIESRLYVGYSGKGRLNISRVMTS